MARYPHGIGVQMAGSGCLSVGPLPNKVIDSGGIRLLAKARELFWGRSKYIDNKASK
jgi:hypothetical protein